MTDAREVVEVQGVVIVLGCVAVVDAVKSLSPANFNYGISMINGSYREFSFNDEESAKKSRDSFVQALKEFHGEQND